MLDFDPNHARAPKLFLDPTTGLVLNKAPASLDPLGTAPAVTPTPTPSTTSTSVDSTVSGTVDDTRAVSGRVTRRARRARRTSGKRPPRITLSCTTRGQGRKVTISCTAKGKDAKASRTALRFRIVKGAKVLATASTRLSHARAKVTLKSKRAIKKGRYTLRIAISRAGGVTGISRTHQAGLTFRGSGGPGRPSAQSSAASTWICVVSKTGTRRILVADQQVDLRAAVDDPPRAGGLQLADHPAVLRRARRRGRALAELVVDDVVHEREVRLRRDQHVEPVPGCSRPR